MGFITFEAVENGLVARYVKVVKKTRPILRGLGIDEMQGFESQMEGMAVRLIPLVARALRKEGLIPKADDFDVDEVVERSAEETEQEKKEPEKPKTETFYVLEPVAVFCGDKANPVEKVIAEALAQTKEAHKRHARPDYDLHALGPRLATQAYPSGLPAMPSVPASNGAD